MDQSLYDKAGLVLFPSGYKDGKLYNIKPFDKSFDFSRGADLWATRVNADGLIEPMIELGEELVANGDFSDDNTGWLEVGESLISGGSARIYSSAGSLSSIQQNSILTIGKTYEVKFTVISSSGPTLIDNSSFSWNTTTLGEKRFIYTATSDYLMFKRSSTCDVVIDNVSVKEVTPLENTPRIDYSDGTPSLLLEPSRTNLVTYSEDLTNSTKSGTATVTPNTTTSPDGTLTADTISGATDVVWASNNVRLGFTVSPSTTYTFSCYIKLGTATTVKIALRDGSTGATTESAALTTQGWNRLTVTATTGASTTALSGLLGAADGTFYAWGAQLEEGSYATSYIPTYSTIATRSADVCVGAGDASTFNDSEGVLYAEITSLSNDGTVRIISVSDGTVNNRIGFQYFGSSDEIRFFVQGSASTSGDHTLDNSLESNKIAFKYKSGDLSLWVNGVEEVVNSTAFSLSNLSELNFDRGDGSFDFYGKAKAIIYFPEALTDEQLQALTT